MPHLCVWWSRFDVLGMQRGWSSGRWLDHKSFDRLRDHLQYCHCHCSRWIAHVCLDLGWHSEMLGPQSGVPTGRWNQRRQVLSCLRHFPQWRDGLGGGWHVQLCIDVHGHSEVLGQQRQQPIGRWNHHHTIESCGSLIALQCIEYSRW